MWRAEITWRGTRTVNTIEKTFATKPEAQRETRAAVRKLEFAGFPVKETRITSAA